MGTAFSWNPYPPLKRFVAELVRRTRPPIEIEAPSAIEVSALLRARGGTARGGPDEWVIHLVNYAIPFFRHAYSEEFHKTVRTYFYNLEDIVPVRDIRVTFHDFKPTAANMPLQNRDLEITGNPPSLVVPEVEMHEVIVVR